MDYPYLLTSYAVYLPAPAHPLTSACRYHLRALCPQRSHSGFNLHMDNMSNVGNTPQNGEDPEIEPQVLYQPHSTGLYEGLLHLAMTKKSPNGPKH